MISIRNVSKVFRIPHQVTKTLYHRLTSILTNAYEYEEFYALRDVSLDVQEGEFLGIMGPNGSGKTTLLRIIAGVYRPTAGICLVRGEVAPLLELGLGFQPRLTCRDNVFIYGALLGLPRDEMRMRYSEIMRFAELERFSDAPLDHLSSGMKMRLAFSVAIRSSAPILLVDEVLAVGDAIFQEKCREVFGRFKKEGRTVLLVSHDSAVVEGFCDRAVSLEGGVLIEQKSFRESDDRGRDHTFRKNDGN
jgi:ABC-type polysaccharide/polyol phosphate transport system ATPase subunit